MRIQSCAASQMSAAISVLESARIRRNDLSIYQSLFFQDEIFVAVKIEHFGQSCCFSVIAPTFASMIGVMLVEPKHSQREKHYAWLPALFLERRFARNKAFVLQFLADESDSERAINWVRFRIERSARPCHLFRNGRLSGAIIGAAANCTVNLQMNKTF